jgi:hypothetical protein
MFNHEGHEGHEGLVGKTIRGFVFLVCFVVSLFVLVRPGELLAQMDLSQVSGQPLPSPDLPVGTVTVRVIRGTLANNVAGQTVDMTIDGQTRQLKTDAEGRVQVDQLRPGTRVKAVTVVDGERIESKDITVADTGIRVMLVAGAAANAGAASGPPAAPVAGAVAFGPESRVVAEFTDDRLSVYFLLEVVNPGLTPVDTGGPLIIELPRTARGATALQDSTKQATVNVDHVIVTGPFPPGKIPVRVAFELPAPGGTARVSAKLPAPLPQVIVIAGQLGGIDLVSPQITAKRDVTDQGQPIIVGTGPALQAGQTLEFDITGLPHRARWPQYVALAIAGAFVLAGIWGAATARRR